MNAFRRICALLVGIVLFLAGFLKLMDPLGASLVVEEYFKFFHVGFLTFASKVVAEILSLLETIIGAALIVCVKPRLTCIAAWIMMAVFTAITAILWFFDPPMDCGCFGQAIHLTHAQSFWKNLILCALLAIATLPLSKFGQTRKSKYVGFAIAVITVLFFAAYSLVSIPAMDFTSFAPGAEFMPESVASDRVLIYEKNGKEGAFSLGAALPDSSWTFLREELSGDSLYNDGREAVELSFSDADGEYCDSLLFRGELMVVSVYDADRLDDDEWCEVASFTADATTAGYLPIVLVASTPGAIGDKLSELSLAPCSYYADRRTLMTFNRSNGGVTFIRDGEIVRKWASSSRPDADVLAGVIEKNSRSHLSVQGVLLYVFAVMLLL